MKVIDGFLYAVGGAFGWTIATGLIRMVASLLGGG